MEKFHISATAILCLLLLDWSPEPIVPSYGDGSLLEMPERLRGGRNLGHIEEHL